MRVTSKINMRGIKLVHDIAIESLIETADALETNLKKSKTVPKGDTGELERSLFVDKSKKSSGTITIVNSGLPYPRRLYFHPEYNFRKDKNPNAGGEWFEPYISGNKKDYASKTFARIMRGKMK